jgi:hypothetical protein
MTPFEDGLAAGIPNRSRTIRREQRIDLGSSVLEDLSADVLVGVHGDSDVRVSKHPGHHYDVHPRLEAERRRGVTRVVEPDHRQTGPRMYRRPRAVPRPASSSRARRWKPNVIW